VRDEIAQIVGFWLDQGLSGFRVDAVPFLLEPIGLPEGALADPHKLVRDLRAYMCRRRGDAILVGEVNMPVEDLRAFFGDEDGDELNMLLSFVGNQALFLALARGEAAPLAEALAALPAIPPDGQWATFVRNHDELTLDKLGEAEREEVFAAFAPDEDMRLYGRGIRRRLPTMLGGDERRMRMAYSLAFSLPGTPVLVYGEEIGMPENLAIEGRYSVRAPMQWTPGRHGGFSTVEDPGALCRPVGSGDGFGPDQVSVARQRRDPHSLLSWMERLIRRRKETPELGWGTFSLLETGEPAVLAHRCDWDGTAVVALHNLGERKVALDVPLGDADDVDELVDLFGDDDVRPQDDGRVQLALEPYGHRWYRVRRHGARLPP
jgi:maltose alpha-D-glucosyltransferase/alpha-amylase